uniref:Small ribosomal subunit protein uS3c n=1 Tax=Boodleopsis sp. FL1161 TaxID=2364084 RepID=A0A386AZ73_9CHLO|nr:ribosomal protein S3 [Boodleopsis sp. FL1161]
MGQKVHPIGFRLGMTNSYLSTWFAQKQNYSKYLFEDKYIRNKISQQYKNANLEKIKILRKTENNLKLIIYAEKPIVIVGLEKKNLRNFQQEIKKSIKLYRQKNDSINKSSKIKLAIHVFYCSNISASSLAYYLIELLEKRYSYRFAIKMLLKKKLLVKPLGIKIQISGRLNGAEIARQEWIHNGRLPLQTLKANIDYSSKKAQTIYGSIGIKVWVFKNFTN